MDDVIVSTQNMHGTPVRLTRNSLTYGEDVVAVDDVIAIMQEPYDAPGAGNLVTVLVSRRGGPQGALPALVIEGLEKGQADELSGAIHDFWRGNP